MQYLNRSEQYKEPCLSDEDRRKKTLFARRQQTLFGRQATFDNFGLPRPKMPEPVADPYLEWVKKRNEASW
jgi:hypothetical protein